MFCDKYNFGIESKLNIFDLSYWDTSNVVSMKGLFKNCKCQVKGLNRWNVSKVIDMSETTIIYTHLMNLLIIGM